MNDLSPTKKRRRSSRGGTAAAEPLPPKGLTWLTDIALFSTLFLVTATFAGRSALGQLVFVCLAVGTALIWSLREMLSETPKWRPSRTVWLWGIGALIAGAQVAPLSKPWLDWISPEHARLLTLWNSDSLGLFPAWTTLSFNPSETISGLVTFLCYGLVFLVAVQRIETIDDVERMLRGIVCLGISAAIFGLAQNLFSNHLFFWVYQHPVVNPADVVLGPFTNRNHFAQFLASAIGPAVWWIVRSASPPAEQHVGFGGVSPAHRWFSVACLSLGLAVMLLAGFLSLSRGGSLALAIALLAVLVLLTRRGHLLPGVLPVVLGIVLLVGGGMAATRYQMLMDRIDGGLHDERATIWMANIRLAQRFPWLGTGVGTHVFSHPLETDRMDDKRQFTHAESGYLQIASECGFLGLGLALTMIGTVSTGAGWRIVPPPARQHGRGGGDRRQPDRQSAARVLRFLLVRPGVHAGHRRAGGLCVPLAQMARTTVRGVPEPVRPRPRIAWAGAICGLTALACWMISVKLPGAVAEPHQTAFLNILYHAGDDHTLDEEDLENLENEKVAELVATARANPHDCFAQLGAAAGYLRVFGQRQMESDNPMSLDQLRDAAVGSEFESREALQDWLDAAIGENRKYLKAVRHYARRALRNCPLEGTSYIYLSRLEFLPDPQSRLEEPLRQQALTVRPFNATINFEIGKANLLKGDFDAAMVHWKSAFRRSLEYRQEIADALAKQFPAAKLVEEFAPDCQGLGVLLAAYRAAGQEEELPLLQERYAAASLEQAKKLNGVQAEFAWLEAVRVYRESDRPDEAIRTAEAALEEHSQSLQLRKTLGELLIDQGDFAAAAKHLQWASVHSPDDAALKQLAANTHKESLRRQTTAERDPSVQRR